VDKAEGWVRMMLSERLCSGKDLGRGDIWGGMWGRWGGNLQVPERVVLQTEDGTWELPYDQSSGSEWEERAGGGEEPPQRAPNKVLNSAFGKTRGR
jgi:hypothetical protein